MTTLQAVISPEISGKLLGAALTLIVMGIGYIARTAHNISEQVGKVSRTLFGEDGKSGLHVAVEEHEGRLSDHHERLLRVENHLDLPRNRTRDPR